MTSLSKSGSRFLWCKAEMDVCFGHSGKDNLKKGQALSKPQSGSSFSENIAAYDIFLEILYLIDFFF